MQRVFVLDKNRKPLMPCHPARARELLKKGRASVYRRYPFTIIIHDREGGNLQDIQIKFDPGSKTTGIALVANFKRGLRCIWAGELTHRGEQIKMSLLSRSHARRNRRVRNLRYRQPRFSNRKNSVGRLMPSLMSRVHNICTWATRLMKSAPITHLALESVKFDTQKMANSEISGVEYQQGTLHGYEIREYLLEKFEHKCAYCGVTNTRMEVEHITPKSRGGTNRVSNLTIACHDCNQQKGNNTAKEFGYPDVQKLASKTMKDASAVNSTRKKLLAMFECGFNFDVEIGTGALTSYNRNKQGYPKAHWIDATCVGISGDNVYIPLSIQPLLIKAVGHGNRQMTKSDKHGFPRATRKNVKVYFGFQTGDMAKAVVATGNKIGVYVGKVIVRARGNFKLQTSKQIVDGINYRFFAAIHKADGYIY